MASLPTRRELYVILTSAVICSLALLPVVFSRAARADSSTGQQHDLQQLEHDRVALLKQIADLAAQESASGLMRPDEAAEDSEAVAEAELEYATTPQGRIAALKEGLADAQRSEAAAAVEAKAGVVGDLVELQLKADELRWAIALNQEEQRSQSSAH
ncbi:MAG TPA: hypothetical protein VMD30_13255 [Tepidisphaeraceae bacterium]|nr:hypothetical protein [Tepidisphaeraceae bacterium]